MFFGSFFYVSLFKSLCYHMELIGYAFLIIFKNSSLIILHLK